jgi:hypothetical protein
LFDRLFNRRFDHSTAKRHPRCNQQKSYPPHTSIVCRRIAQAWPHSITYRYFAAFGTVRAS